jgi:hypothetical protein
MKRERWGQVEQVFHAALQVEERRRGELVRQSCAGDEALRREVESLLAHHQNAGDFIQSFRSRLLREMSGKANGT